MHFIWVLFVENTIISSLIFLYLVFKARIRAAFLYRDNLAIIIVASAIAYLVLATVLHSNRMLAMVASAAIVLLFIILLTLFRFYRNPVRKCYATKNDIVSPADGFITYVKRIDRGRIPFSVKGKNVAKLSELSKVDILHTPCWLIGITMTLFDVHYVRSPISGRVILNEYTPGKFLSLKEGSSVVENERNTSVIDDDQQRIGVIQIASKRVRGIRTFIENGQNVQRGQQIGMITFGSQTDILLPITAVPEVTLGKWVYGGKTKVASFEAGNNGDENSL